MDGKFHFIVFLLLFRYAICRKCNCKSVDILQSIVQREMMAREMLVSRVEMLESKLALGTNNDPIASGHSSDTVVLERLSVLESMMVNFNTKLIEISTERRRVARLSHALTEAWKIHKYGSSVMNENIQNSIDENNKRFNQLTLEVDKHMEVVDSKVELLMNETNKLVTKQLKTVEDGFEVVRSGLNKTFEDYTAQINEDFTELVDKTDSRLIKIMRNECASDPCKNGATCVDGINSFTCICMTGYSGSHCQIDIDECSSNPCFNGATCVDGINSYLCRCQDGYMYEDRFCKVFQDVNGLWRKWISWSPEDITFGTPVVLQGSFTITDCLMRCGHSPNCSSAHVNKISLGCELSTYNPLRGGLSPQSRAGWRVYYYPDLVEVRGIHAWLSQTYHDAFANYSIDGRLDTVSATYGLFAAWAMELELPAKVMVVHTDFEVGEYAFQNRNFTIQVHPSFNDAKTNVNGILCATYTGPGLVKPTNFTCPAAYGKAVRIEHFLNETYYPSLRFREIKVFAL